MARPGSLPFALWAIVFSFVLSARAADTCYYPDGSTDSGHFACSSGGASMCCAEGFDCLSNGLCRDTRYDNNQRILRGGCTDKSWGSGCPQRCTSSEYRRLLLFQSSTIDTPQLTPPSMEARRRSGLRLLQRQVLLRPHRQLLRRQQRPILRLRQPLRHRGGGQNPSTAFRSAK